MCIVQISASETSEFHLSLSIIVKDISRRPGSLNKKLVTDLHNLSGSPQSESLDNSARLGRRQHSNLQQGFQLCFQLIVLEILSGILEGYGRSDCGLKRIDCC